MTAEPAAARRQGDGRKKRSERWGERTNPPRQLTTSDVNAINPSARRRALRLALADAKWHDADGVVHRFGPAQWDTLSFLADSAGRDGIASVSLKRFAKDVGRNYSAVKRDARQLEDAGFIARRHRRLADDPDPRRLDYFVPGMAQPGRPTAWP